MRPQRIALPLLGAMWLVAVASAQRGGPAVPRLVLNQGSPVEGLPGNPLPGLTPREFAEFRLGLDDFLEVETAAEGLGPAFNGTSCAMCHNVPTVGGTSAVLETRVGTRDVNGAFHAVDPSGETLVHLFSTPTHGCQPSIPATATVVARRAPIPVFGAGLVEQIADADLLALEDPLDANGDGISGRAAVFVAPSNGAPRVGRFGWKAQHTSLLVFGADAYRNEMGITNDIFPAEVALGISVEAMRRCDPIPDPEDVRDRKTGRRGIDNFAAFMRLLAPVARGPITPEVIAGEAEFKSVGCAACHVPLHFTSPNSNLVFDRRPVAAFSDFLLHDVGTGDGIVQAEAGADEIRTPALWGLRFRRPLLHDGRAITIEDAIQAHGREASGARARYQALDAAARQALLAFLKSL